MALDERTVCQSSQPFLHTSVRPSGNFILACFHAFHVDAHIAVDSKTIFGTSAGNICRVRAGNERLCRDTSRIHTGATKLVTFNNGDCHARGREPRSQRRACLAGPDDDGIELSRHEAPPLRKIAGATFGERAGAVLAPAADDHVVVAQVGSSVPACSATMYAAYHSGQFSSRCPPIRFSCCPWAASARRNALARSFADAKVVVAESMRPGSRVVISWNSQPLPSGSWNEANER